MQINRSFKENNMQINSLKLSFNKSIKLLSVIIFSYSLLSTSNSYAVQANPCGAELCLSGVGLAGGIKECKVHIKKFFSISATGKHGIFLPGVTYGKRYKWLNKCKSGNKAFKVMIMSAYGNLPSYPF